MKRFLSRNGAKPPPKPVLAPVPVALTTGLQPKYIVPAVPHPYPYDHIALLVTKDGLLLRPHISEQSSPISCVKVAWGKTAKTEEVSENGNEGYDWKDALIVYGIVGIVELFSASHMLVITAKEDLGNLFDPTHIVYGVKSVAAIPLFEDRARIVVNTLASKQSFRPAIHSSNTMDSLSSPADDNRSNTDEAATSTASSPRIQFSEPEILRNKAAPSSATFSLNSDEHGIQSPSDSTSDLSLSGSDTPSTADTQHPSAPIAKALAARLSFWSRLSKRGSLFSPDQDIQQRPEKSVPEPLALDAIVSGESEEHPSEVIESILSATAPAPETAEEKQSELEDKILRECIREFSKGGMYYAYTFDLTRSLQHKREQLAKSQKQHALLADLNALPSKDSHDSDSIDPLAEPNPTLPLWRRVDRQYWWNEWLAKPFVDAGLHSYILPIMQGYYQAASFPVPDPQESEGILVDYAIVSRRSRDRAGLRYQRRGIDDDAHVANFVESETIMRVKRDGATNIFSYVQIRGSIPLFWTQTGYGLKPPPLVSEERTREQHLEAMKRHFEKTILRHGPQTIVNLAEQHGKEGGVTSAYRDYLTELNMADAKYNEYDFHQETKGMKYENIAHLVDAMEKTFDHQAFLWICDNVVLSQQKGVFRVNCIDCLDRTNVVQSAFAKNVLNKQLSAVALLAPHNVERTEADRVFNDVWANNGDAISRAYAGTSALKGDFTRMYTSTFSDWFTQAVIDYMLGNRTISVFSEFLLKLQSTDPRDLIRLSKIRSEAIATSVSRCLVEGERLLSGWTLFSPEELNATIGEKFEEKVLLLTTTALYVVSYDYTLEKVKLYTRVPLGDIIGIKKGAYILSPLEEASRDPLQNAGFIITWMNNNQVTRLTSYSLRNSLDSNASSSLPPTPIFNKFTTGTPSTPIPNRDLATPVAQTAAQRSFASIISSFAIPSTSATTTPTSTTPSTPVPGTPTPKRASRGLSLTLGPRPTASRRGSRTLSSILTNTALPSAAPGTPDNRSFAAFKMLPIDPARRRASSYGNGSEYAQAADELTGATSCKEAVDLVVDAIRRACEDAGSTSPEDVGRFVEEEDVVGLADAQRMTSMYAKMEYGVKRLLWLGG